MAHTPGNNQIGDAARKFAEHFRFMFPPTCCYFADKKPENAVTPSAETWTCMFSFIEQVVDGGTLCLSDENSGCSGAACYLGFRKPNSNAGVFLAEKERFKKSAELGRAFYKEIEALPASDLYFILERFDKLRGRTVPDVVTLWVNAESLLGLVTLANYDRSTNDNVMIPFASGCQGIWTLPFKEKNNELPKCVVGMMDPAVRIYLPSEVLSFSMPVKRFVEMAENISGSFLSLNSIVRSRAKTQ